jgi:hypothetical protein
MYAGVPTVVPLSVSFPSVLPSFRPSALPSASAAAFAIPKSATNACPAASRMFSGLMSR